VSKRKEIPFGWALVLLIAPTVMMLLTMLGCDLTNVPIGWAYEVVGAFFVAELIVLYHLFRNVK